MLYTQHSSHRSVTAVIPLLVLGVIGGATTGCDRHDNGEGDAADTAVDAAVDAVAETGPTDVDRGLDADTAPNDTTADAAADAIPSDVPADTAVGEDAADAADAGDAAETGPSSIVLEWDFRQGKQGWSASFTDYSPGMQDSIDFAGDLRQLPTELNSSGTGYLLGGTNTPDDLFMFLKREVGPAEGLAPSTDYELNWTLEFASDAPSGCVGIGGAPGESVYLKAGGSTVEPVSELQEDGDRYTLNVDKSNQSQGGANASVVGHVANGIPCEDAEGEYVRLEKLHTHPEPISTDSEGNLWLFAGTDSGFEGRTKLYYIKLTVELTPQP